MVFRASRFIRLASTVASLLADVRRGDRVGPDAVRGFQMKTARFLAVAVCLIGFPFSLLADTNMVTLPVAASLLGKGGVPFISDVRVFNTSYSDVLTVTAVYRFGGQQATFQLGAREAKAFEDIGANLFGAPNSFGAVEFVTSGSSDDLVVTSQVRSPASGGGHVGMFVPGLPSSAASAVTVLTSLVNGESRTNVGIYNPNAVGVTATIRLYDGSVPLGTVPVPVGPHETKQQNDIYGSVGFASLVRSNGYATVESGDPQSPLFTYAAEVDNSSGDFILIVGSADSPAPPGFHPPTATPSGPAPTPTPSPSAGAIHTVDVGKVGSSFSDSQTGSSSTAVHVGDTVKWIWSGNSIGPHSTTSGTCTGGGYYGDSCTPDNQWDSNLHLWDSDPNNKPFSYSHTFTATGTFRYYCANHGTMMTGTILVHP